MVANSAPVECQYCGLVECPNPAEHQRLLSESEKHWRELAARPMRREAS